MEVTVAVLRNVGSNPTKCNYYIFNLQCLYNIISVSWRTPATYRESVWGGIIGNHDTIILVKLIIIFPRVAQWLEHVPYKRATLVQLKSRGPFLIEITD